MKQTLILIAVQQCITRGDRGKYAPGEAQNFCIVLVMIWVYFRRLKKGVVLPLGIVKRGRATP